jgi:hypothetical protein
MKAEVRRMKDEGWMMDDERTTEYTEHTEKELFRVFRVFRGNK